MASSIPSAAVVSAISAASVAGVIESTMVQGTRTPAAIQAARSASRSAAKATSAACNLVPLLARLSQGIGMNGGVPAARRADRPPTSHPTMLRGTPPARSCAMSGFVRSSVPSARRQ
jgi:hypothetical protein